MANKTWNYEVYYVNPLDLEDKTPAQRGEEVCKVQATSVPRAVSKAKKEITEEWDGLENSQIVIVECRRAAK